MKVGWLVGVFWGVKVVVGSALVGVNVLSGTAVSAIVEVTSTASWEAGCDVLQAASSNPVANINSRKDLFTMIVFGLYPPGEIFRIKKY